MNKCIFLNDLSTASFMKVPEVPVKPLSKARRLAAKAAGQPTNPKTRALAAEMLKGSRKFQKEYKLSAGATKGSKNFMTYRTAAHDLEHKVMLKKGLPAYPTATGEMHMERGLEVGKGKASKSSAKIGNADAKYRIAEREAQGKPALKKRETRKRMQKINDRFVAEGKELSQDKNFRQYQEADSYLKDKAFTRQVKRK